MLTPPAAQPTPSNVSRFSAFQYSPGNAFGDAWTSRTVSPFRGQINGPYRCVQSNRSTRDGVKPRVSAS